MPLINVCEGCGRDVITDEVQPNYLCERCQEKCGDRIDDLLRERESEGAVVLEVDSQDGGLCSHCKTKLVPLDGGGGFFCPNDCGL